MVYSCNTLVKISMTVHNKDTDASGARSVFIGQLVIDSRKILERTFFTGKPIRCKGKLGSLQIDPREQGTKTSFRMENNCTSCNNHTKLPDSTNHSVSTKSMKINPNKESNHTFGKVSFEIHPVSNTESRCGILEEILSALLKGARKKWYAVLADKQLYLFSQYGDSRPKVVISLNSPGLYINWHDPECTIIKIMSLDQSWFLTCPNTQHRQSWYNKVGKPRYVCFVMLYIFVH